MLSFVLHMRIGEQDLLLPVAGHIVFHHRCRSRLVGGAEALSGCNASFSSRNLLRQCPCEPILCFFEPQVGRLQASSPQVTEAGPV
jgi:hypothetical protein